MSTKRLATFSSIGLVGLLAMASGCGTTAHSANSDQKTPIVFYSAGPKSLATDLAQAFEKTDHIPVKVYESTTGKVLGRLEAEKSHPQADVVALADWSAGESLDRQGMLLRFRPSQVNHLMWTSSSSTYWGYSGSALGITYNTRLVKAPPSTWSAVLNPQWDGKVVMPDPAQSGSAVDFVGGYLQNHQNSWNYFNQLKAHGLVIQGANAVALDEVLTGSKDMVLAGVDYMAYSAMAKGNPINVVYPRDGTVVNPRPIMILKSSQHAKEDEEFVNFVLSPAGQKIVAKEYLLPGNTTVKASPKRTSLSSIHQWAIDWAQLAKNKAGIIAHVDGTSQ